MWSRGRLLERIFPWWWAGATSVPASSWGGEMSRRQGSVYSPVRGAPSHGTMLRPSLRWAAFLTDATPANPVCSMPLTPESAKGTLPPPPLRLRRVSCAPKHRGTKPPLRPSQPFARNRVCSHPDLCLHSIMPPLPVPCRRTPEAAAVKDSAGLPWGCSVTPLATSAEGHPNIDSISAEDVPRYRAALPLLRALLS